MDGRNFCLCGDQPMRLFPEAGSRPVFFQAMALVLGAVLLFAFARTFFLQPLFSAPSPTMPAIVHGVIGTAWFALLAWQAWLVRSRRIQDHRRFGKWFGPALGMVAVATSIWVAALSALEGRRSGSGLGTSEIWFIQGGTILWFSVLALAGFATVRRPDYHKRFMILASIAMLAPGFARIGRLFRDGGPPTWDSAVMAIPLIAALAWHDLRTLRRVHPVTLWAGLGYIAFVSVRLPIAKSDLWNHTIVPALFGI
jgi:hypothetical protein